MFWKDLWLDSEPAQSYPRAYSFAKKEDISVQELLSSGDLATLFHLPLSPQAMDELRDLQLATRHISMTNTTDGDDWTFAWGSKVYASSKYYRFCFRNIIPHEDFLWLWKSKSTPKLKFFCWLLLSDRLNTRNMLRRRHYNIGNDFSCMLCSPAPEETLEHLFFRCPFSENCWDLLGISWETVGDGLDLISAAKGS